MSIQDKENFLKFINLDLNNIPNVIVNLDDIDIRSSEIINKKNYKVYKYVSIKDINIVLTNTRRLDEPSKKVENMRDLSFYLNEKNEEEYFIFSKLLENASVTDINEIEKFQNNLKNKLPSKIKYTKDYIWQIYYIERTNKYYMIVPLQETETQGFFYVLKKKIEKSNEKIYVPICNIEYSNQIVDNNKINALVNNLHLFTKGWPLVYEVYDKQDNCSINIIGDIQIYENIKSNYKMIYKNSKDIIEFYELIKTLAYINEEIPNFYKFDILLDSKGAMSFWYNDFKLSNNNLDKFYELEIKRHLKSVEDIEKIQKGLNKKLNRLKIEERKLNSEFLNKQKQISTFLECKKTFFGRVKYFFKLSKKKLNTETVDLQEFEIEQEFTGRIIPAYTNDIEDMIYVCKDLRTKTTVAATTRLDIQNLSIKIDILKKKIENATKFIEEIESHKKSIFEFWKFTNKDENNQLSEGINKIENEQKIEKIFNINEDLIRLGKAIDLNQRRNLTLEEQDAIFVADVIGIENLTKPERSIELLEKKEKIFQGIVTHREKQKSIKNILGNNNKEYSLKLKEIYKNFNNALKKCVVNINLPVYSLNKPEDRIMEFEIDPLKFDFSDKEIELYKLNIKPGTSALALSNIVLFNNRNDTLPVGMDYSTNIFVDLRKAEIIEVNKKSNYILKLMDNSTKHTITKINIIEFNM